MSGLRLRRRDLVDLVGVVALLFLVVLAFPSLISWASEFPLPLRILVDLSPYVVSLGVIVWICAWRGVALGSGLGFSTDHLARQVKIALVLFAVTISFVVVPVLLGIDALGEPETRPFQFTYQIVRTFFVVGLGEELVWRGFVLGKASSALGSEKAGIIASSVLFGLWHYPAGQDVLQVLATAAIGLVYALARSKVKHCSTLATGLAHGLHGTAIIIMTRLLV